MGTVVTPEELLRQIRKWLIMPSSDDIERTAWPEMVAQIDTTLRDSNDAATRMRDFCVEKVRAMKDGCDWQAIECAAAFNYDGEWKAYLKAKAMTDIITALQSLEGEQEKSK